MPFAADRRTNPRILPFGDSITYGVGSSDGSGYRGPLAALAAADGTQLNFLGTQFAGPATISGRPFSYANEGRIGWTIAGPYPGTPTAGLTTITPSPALDGAPDIILLHIGINDVNYTAGLTTLLTRLTTLVQSIYTAIPWCKVVVAQNTTANAALPPEWFTYVNGIPGMAATFAAAGRWIRTVNMQVLTLADLSDAVHPNDAGYAKMAAIWYPAIRDLL
jgi:hypothetical protein